MSDLTERKTLLEPAGTAVVPASPESLDIRGRLEAPPGVRFSAPRGSSRRTAARIYVSCAVGAAWDFDAVSAGDPLAWNGKHEIFELLILPSS
jgi:hypothetical protein